MAERIPREESLRRVHGVGALFSAAYGNVGSSIYYALGVVASFALGLTPVTFLIAGLIFAFTAATYIEATVMYPEAGGSASFARHAFNEVVSFIAGWGQMLNYIITAAISAFFVPHYLGVFWPALHHGPGDVIAGIVVVGLLAALNVKGTQESSRLNLVLAIGDLCTQILLVAIGIALVLSPSTLVDNVHLGVAPSWGNAALGIAVGMIAYTGIETISNMAEEARDVKRTVPRGTELVVLAVLGQARLPGAPLLVRRIALFHGRAHLGAAITPALPEPEAGLEAALQFPLSRSGAATDRRSRRPRHVLGLDRGDGAEPAHASGRRRLDAARARHLLLLPGALRSAPVKDREGGDAGAAWSRGGRVRERPGRLRGRGALLGGGGGDRRAPGRAPATRNSRAGDRHRAHPPAAGRATRAAGKRGPE